MVRNKCEEKFGDWWGPGGWQPFYQFSVAGSCHASVEEHRYKIAIRPPPTCYMKIWFREWHWLGYATTGQWGTSFVFEWQGTGNPCVQNSGEKIVEGGWRYLTKPGASAFPSGTYLVVWKYSCIPGYEPDDPVSPEPGQIQRPCPDIRTNGYVNPASKKGCLDYCDSNYDPSATCNDGDSSGCSGNSVCGCMDPAAANYDPSALRDDGSCWYEEYE